MFDNLEEGKKYKVNGIAFTFIRYNDNEYSAGESALFSHEDGNYIWFSKDAIIKGYLMTFDEYVIHVNTNPVKGWRLGQTYFNCLYVLNPTLADTIRGDYTLDPFYNNDKLDAFLEYVQNEWVN